MSKYDSIRQAALEANLKLPELGLVIFTFGNVSVCDRKLGAFAIKPSGVHYSELEADMMVIVDIDGNTIEGELRPSSDTLTHAYLYKSWSEIGAIVHTHSTHATAWAQAQRDIPILGTTHADHVAGNIPCALPMSPEMVKGNYELETGKQITQCFTDRKLDYRQVEMMLVGSHAPFCWGKDSAKAIYNAAILEEIARMATLTLQINPAAPPLSNALVKKHYTRKHGPDAYYGQ
ncbi:MAG: L-ribulose-5-phosphate 4-epimerase [Cyclobacteriaceae bacterium]|nr:L-ribulose-5-phosphate 4-epimerase [Cyclobacteriaceae bacterium]